MVRHLCWRDIWLCCAWLCWRAGLCWGALAGHALNIVCLPGCQWLPVASSYQAATRQIQAGQHTCAIALPSPRSATSFLALSICTSAGGRSGRQAVRQASGEARNPFGHKHGNGRGGHTQTY